MKRIKEIEDYINRLIDSSTPLNPLWNVEILKGRKPSWNYIDGCMMASIISLYEITKNQKYLDFVISYTDYFISDDGKIKDYDIYEYSLDDLSESRILFDLYKYTNNLKYLKAIEYTYQQILIQPRIKEGNFWHKPRHPHQVWLDGLFMGQVFYMRYETIINNKANYSDIRMQYENVRKIMFNENTKLYYHGYDSSKESFWCNKETGLSKGYWLRAIGWYIISLIEILNDMDKNHNDYGFYSNLFIEAIDGILLYQDNESKMFYQVPEMKNREGNYLETSGSAMIAYALFKGVRLNILDIKYKNIAEDIFNGICNKYLKIYNGNIELGGICLVAGLGNALWRDGSFEHYIKEEVVTNDAKGVGPFIMAYIEGLIA